MLTPQREGCDFAGIESDVEPILDERAQVLRARLHLTNARGSVLLPPRTMAGNLSGDHGRNQNLLERREQPEDAELVEMNERSRIGDGRYQAFSGRHAAG
jgi:hypothetical protein